MTFDQHIGMTYNDSFNEAKIDTEAHHLNPTGNINGGVLISLADNLATGVASRHWREKTGGDAFLVGVDLHAVMLSNQMGGTITARAEPVRVGWQAHCCYKNLGLWRRRTIVGRNYVDPCARDKLTFGPIRLLWHFTPPHKLTSNMLPSQLTLTR